MTHNYYSQATAPVCFITKGKQRVKQYDSNVVYLKKGDEFELELFNPTSNKILAKIQLNGKSLGSGLILRPGERVFLERYFDEARKFLFDTYEIDGNDSQAVNAIRDNGDVEIEFFEEHKYTPSVWNSGTVTIQPYVNPWPSTIWVYTSGTGYVSKANPTFTYTGDNGVYTCNYFDGNIGNVGQQISATAKSFGGGTRSASASPASLKGMPTSQEVKFSGSLDLNDSNDFCCYSASIETGRVEKGSSSGQSFVYDNTEFNSYYTWKTTWKILPESRKPFVKEDLSVFCTNCGAKRKKASFKFCPNCGTKF